MVLPTAVARSPYQSVYRTEVERIETPSAIAGNAMRLSMPSDTYSGPSIQAAPPWYSSAWSTFWGRLKDGQPLITDPRGSSSFSSGSKTYHVPNYVHDDSFHWIVGTLYHRAIVGDVIGAAETPLRFAANPTRYTRAVGAGLYNAVVNVPRLPEIWEQTPDYQREDLAFRIIGLGLGSAYGAGSVAAGTAVRQPITVTENMIRNATRLAPLRSQQAGGLSLPRVQEYVNKILAGETAPPIKVDGSIIIDGNHRYVAGRITGIEPAIQPWAGARPSKVVLWNEIRIDPKPWP